MTDSTESNILSTQDATFEVDVFERSRERLVIVDFWAEWCAPCRLLAPILDALASESPGRFVLVKANTDENPESAARLGVTGIPALFALLDGEVVDAVQGALPEAELRRWLESLESRADLAAAKKLVDTDQAAAEQSLRKLLDRQPDQAEASIALAELYVEQGRENEAADLLDRLEARGFLEPEAERIRALLSLKAVKSTDVEAAREAARAEPDNFALQLELARALASREEYESAFEICLQLVSADRQQTGEQARQLMVDVFRILPEDSALTSEYRRKLSMALY